MDPKWVLNVPIILVKCQSIWMGPIYFGRSQIILDRSKFEPDQNNFDPLKQLGPNQLEPNRNNFYLSKTIWTYRRTRHKTSGCFLKKWMESSWGFDTDWVFNFLLDFFVIMKILYSIVHIPNIWSAPTTFCSWLSMTKTPIDHNVYSEKATKFFEISIGDLTAKGGQLILKCLFCVFNSSIKQKKKKSTWGTILVKSNFFRSFLGRIEGTKKTFRNQLTFSPVCLFC